MGKLSTAVGLRLYRENVDFAKTGEEFTENLVKNAALVHAGLLQVRELHDALLAAEESWGKDSPFNSVLKLMLLLKKVRDIAKENPKGGGRQPANALGAPGHHRHGPRPNHGRVGVGHTPDQG